MTVELGVAGLRLVGLEHLQRVADLQTRMDRKYVVAGRTARSLVAAHAERTRVLGIEGLRSHRYASVYFDTPDLVSFRGAAHGRRRRFKVRTRSYQDSSITVLEVKTTSGRGETVKVRLPYNPENWLELTPEGRCFVTEHLRSAEVADRLRPTLTTTYRRTTLLDDAGSRWTVDDDLVCERPDGRRLRLEGCLVETKSPGHATCVDHWLWAAGIRPLRVSKYATGLAALTPDLPANRWSRTLRTHFATGPAPQAATSITPTERVHVRRPAPGPTYVPDVGATSV